MVLTQENNHQSILLHRFKKSNFKISELANGKDRAIDIVIKTIPTIIRESYG